MGAAPEEVGELMVKTETLKERAARETRENISMREAHKTENQIYREKAHAAMMRKPFYLRRKRDDD